MTEPQPAVPPPPCTIKSGWTLVHQVESDSDGNDRFIRQTCDVRRLRQGNTVDCSMFIPSAVKPNENKIHVCFSANGVSGNVSNAVTGHALRAAAEASREWILIAVMGDDTLLPTVTAQEILDFLDRHGRPRRIDKLRLSCHSRGLFSLAKALRQGTLVAKSPKPPIVDPALVERVVTFDEADISADINGAVRFAGIDSQKLFGYRVNGGRIPPITTPPNWTISASQTVDLTGFTIPNLPNAKTCLQAVIYCRLIEDAQEVNRLAVIAGNAVPLVIPSDIQNMVASVSLPPLGSLTSRSSPSPPLVNFKTFYTTKSAEIKKLNIQKLFSFVNSKDLARLGKPFPDGIYQHHLFVAEFAHEVTDILPPQP